MYNRILLLALVFINNFHVNFNFYLFFTHLVGGEGIVQFIGLISKHDPSRVRFVIQIRFPS